MIERCHRRLGMRGGGRRSASEGRKAATHQKQSFSGDELRRAFGKELNMTMAARAPAPLKSSVCHRVYADPDGTETAFCRLITDEGQLLRLAVGIDRVELRQSPGSSWIPPAITEPIIQALRSADLVAGSADPRAERMARELGRRMTDALARIRIRFNRRLLAGTTRLFDEDGDRLALVLIFARKGVDSCEWKVAA
jgi:hypothetical protein